MNREVYVARRAIRDHSWMDCRRSDENMHKDEGQPLPDNTACIQCAAELIAQRDTRIAELERQALAGKGDERARLVEEVARTALEMRRASLAMNDLDGVERAQAGCRVIIAREATNKAVDALAEYDEKRGGA